MIIALLILLVISRSICNTYYVSRISLSDEFKKKLTWQQYAAIYDVS